MQRGRIILPRYSFPTRGKRVVERTDIAEIVQCFPPAILTTDGEFLFFSRLQLEAAQAFCAAQAVAYTKRYDVWGDLLDPFLDTEFSPEAQQATRQRLRENAGMNDAEIDRLRAQVEAPMLRLTGITWEWQFYGLIDVLMAMKPRTFLGRRRWLAFYAEAMAVAQRGRIL